MVHAGSYTTDGGQSVDVGVARYCYKCRRQDARECEGETNDGASEPALTLWRRRPTQYSMAAGANCQYYVTSISREETV